MATPQPAFQPTDTSSGSLGNYLVQAAYDRYVEFALRAQPLFRAIADKRPVQQAMPGSTVVMDLYADMTANTGTLTEGTDPDATVIGNTTQVTVTLNEYGAAAIVTRRLELFAFSDVDPAIANIVAFNLADSVDTLAQTEMRNSTNTIREVSGALSGTASGAASGVTGTDTFKTRDVRYAVAKLRSNKVLPKKGNLYWAGIHPEVSHDLRAETGAAAWRDPSMESCGGRKTSSDQRGTLRCQPPTSKTASPSVQLQRLSEEAPVRVMRQSELAGI